MPEGPEIHRAAKKVSDTLSGNVLNEVYFKFEELKLFELDLVGQRVLDVSAMGKALLVAFEDGKYLYCHNQLYGKWTVRKRSRPPATTRDLRVMLKTEKGTAFLYSASDIEMLTESQLSTHRYLRKLGPDIVIPTVTEKEAIRHLSQKKFARKALGGLLLDQSFLAGVGNYLRSEILHVCGLHPSVRVQELTDLEIKTLYQSSCAMAKQSLKTGGITNDLRRAEELKSAGYSRRRYRHWVFTRGNQPCYHCGELIKKIQYSGRQLFLCLQCQAVR